MMLEDIIRDKKFGDMLFGICEVLLLIVLIYRIGNRN